MRKRCSLLRTAFFCVRP